MHPRTIERMNPAVGTGTRPPGAERARNKTAHPSGQARGDRRHSDAQRQRRGGPVAGTVQVLLGLSPSPIHAWRAARTDAQAQRHAQAMAVRSSGRERGSARPVPRVASRRVASISAVQSVRPPGTCAPSGRRCCMSACPDGRPACLLAAERATEANHGHAAPGGACTAARPRRAHADSRTGRRLQVQGITWRGGRWTEHRARAQPSRSRRAAMLQIPVVGGCRRARGGAGPEGGPAGQRVAVPW